MIRNLVRYTNAPLLALLMWPVSSLGASSATLVGVYQNCQYVTGGVFVDSRDLSEEEKTNATAAIETAIVRYGFEEALPRASKILKKYGIDYVKVEKQGFAGCTSPSSGKFVQAIANYCGDRLVSAEIRVDGDIFLKRSGKLPSFEAFVDDSLVELRRQGIWDEPRVQVNSEGGCEEEAAPSRG